ncbi:MAG: SWIM zinc finger family protein [Syntrophothermus sp.]|uniref:SWIM zinc finger family protein n=1 Tax=Syntrophothermus sp. TaxID=2736299 RepID=UPI00257A9B11|nr:SWIM zinc finger family protein [Syntrophothermus sp.]NSW81681.1 SWIM zinc finger family protein [Syntrophothermus sp.]
MSRSNRYGGYHPPSQPREVQGGIKAVSQRGSFGKKWWSRRWIAVLESLRLGARLSRGRSYARRGQVLSVEIEPGKVEARVQGSRVKPYKVEIKIHTFCEAEWKKVAKHLAAQPIYAARLLAGEMPEDIEAVFAKANLSLFPSRARDLHTDCSCPDWSNPCKHIAAVYYLLGEEFDRDPFLIFKLRGMDRDRFRSFLTEAMAVPKGDSLAGEEGEESGASARTAEAVLPADPVLFWQGQGIPDIPAPADGGSVLPVALLRQAGPFPFWQGDKPFPAALEPIYQRVVDSSGDLVAAVLLPVKKS